LKGRYFPYTRPHTINNNVNIRRIDNINIIDRVRSCIDVLTEILTVFRKSGNHFINTLCIDLVITYTWLIQAGRADTGGMADNGTVAYTGRHGGY